MRVAVSASCPHRLGGVRGHGLPGPGPCRADGDGLRRRIHLCARGSGGQGASWSPQGCTSESSDRRSSGRSAETGMSSENCAACKTSSRGDERARARVRAGCFPLVLLLRPPLGPSVAPVPPARAPPRRRRRKRPGDDGRGRVRRHAGLSGVLVLQTSGHAGARRGTEGEKRVSVGHRPLPMHHGRSSERSSAQGTNCARYAPQLRSQPTVSCIFRSQSFLAASRAGLQPRPHPD